MADLPGVADAGLVAAALDAVDRAGAWGRAGLAVAGDAAVQAACSVERAPATNTH